MWLLFFLVGAGGLYAWDKYAAKPAVPALPPAGIPGLGQDMPTVPIPAATVFPIPNAMAFTTASVSGTTVAAFGADTRQAMADALSARDWRVNAPLSPQILSIGPPTAANAANIDVVSAINAAAAAGQNVFADADLAQKLQGAPGAPDPTASACFLALSLGVPTPDAATDDGSDSPDLVATTPAEATAALAPDFANGSAFVLFVPAGASV